MRISKLIALTIAITWSSFTTADVLIQNVNVVSGGQKQGLIADILVQGSKITKVGTSLSTPNGAEVIDGRGKTLSPGFFNSHTQLGLSEVGAVSDTADFYSENARVTASLRVSDAINPSSVLLPYNRSLGVTHALVQPDSDAGLFAGTAAIIQLTENNTIKVSSAAMVVKLGAQGKNIAGGSRAVSMALLREAFEDARDFRSNRGNYNSGSRRDYQLSRHDLEALIPVLDRKIPLIVHVDRAIDIERIMTFANKYKLKLIIAGAEEGWRVAGKLAKNKVPVIIDPIYNLPGNYDTLGARLDNAKLLDEAGVTMLFTGLSWHSTHNAYLVRQSAGNAVANGLDYQSAIDAMTINPAKVFGLKGHGEVKVGGKANLVLWSGDPLETSTIAERVFINGENQSMVSRSTRLRDRYFSRLKESLN